MILKGLIQSRVMGGGYGERLGVELRTYSPHLELKLLLGSLHPMLLIYSDMRGIVNAEINNTA